MLSDVVKQCLPFPRESKMLIFGGGFSGQHIATVARSLGVNVFCSRRDLNSLGADFIFDPETNQLPSSSVFEGVTHLLSCIPPSKNGKDPVIQSLELEIKQMPLKWCGYLSTTGVYGDSKGKWVSETDEPNPGQLRSKHRRECEKEWEKQNIPFQILRLPGIYGPGRSAIESIVNRKCRLIDKPDQFFSRIHIDDIAGAIMHLIHLTSEGIKPNVINLADDLPTSNIEVLEYTASLLNRSLPKVESFESASKSLSSMALSFWQESRKVNNKLLCKDLGYSLIHPTYKSGIQECLINYQNKNKNQIKR